MSENRTWLRKLTLSGYKSFDTEGQSIEFGDITVLLGANGSGKSNLVSFIRLLNSMNSRHLQQFVAEQGYASSLLHYGSSETQQIRGKLAFKIGTEKKTYLFTLTHASGDLLVFSEEKVFFEDISLQQESIDLGSGHKESNAKKNPPANLTEFSLWSLLTSLVVYQFYDTSSTAKIKNQFYIEDADILLNDARNLAPFLYRMKNNDKTSPYYDRIVRHIQTIFPQFDDFILKPSANPQYITLNWKEKGHDYLLGPHQLSDGTLRFMALTTLLLQPPKPYYDIIFIDEPELGLHPAAITELAGMIALASQHSQIILATQSPQLVNEFEAKDIVVVERDETDKHSVLKRLDEQELADWLQHYSLSELWEKNVFGGRP